MPISLPVVELVAKTLIPEFEKAPFGKGSKTVYDDAVRKTWQLNPDRVKLTHPNWKAGFDDLTKQVKNRLGLGNVPISFKLYKLLMYGPGGHFLPHQDTEKEDGMFAT
jgi:hypothetical protein